MNVQTYSPKGHNGRARRGSFVIASLLRLGVLAASNSLVSAVPRAVFAPGVVSLGGVPVMRGIGRALRSGRGGGSDRGATAMAGRASAGCLLWVGKHPQLLLLGWGDVSQFSVRYG